MVKIIEDKKRRRPIQKYKIGQWVYVYHENILKRALISGVIFNYNNDLTKMAFTEPTYKIELNLGSQAHRSDFANENEIFNTKEECVVFALENGLIKEDQ